MCGAKGARVCMRFASCNLSNKSCGFRQMTFPIQDYLPTYYSLRYLLHSTGTCWLLLWEGQSADSSRRKI